VLAEIARLRRSEFSGWTHFQISNGRFPQYLKVSSIDQFGDRVAVQVRGAVDPTTAVIGPDKFPEGNFYESTAVVDCKQPVVAMAESRVVTPSGELLAHYKVADPKFLSLSMGIAIAPGQVAETLRKIVCDETLRTPLVTKKQLSEMNFSDLASTPAGDGEIYYQAMQNDKAPVTEKDVVVVIKLDKFTKVTDMLEPSFSGLDLGTYNVDVDRVHFKCNEQKMIVLKSEYYDSAHNLIALVIRNPPGEIPLKERSPLATLQRILCGPREVQK
jgi:hypothetical protein